MEIIRTTSVTKHFGTTTAADDLNLRVSQGEIYGFLGLNGAGKTTLIRILLGMIRPDSGYASLFGEKLTPAFSRWNEVGYLVETPYSYPGLSVTENLKVYYRLRQLDNPAVIPAIIEALKLSRYKDVKAKHLSLGNQQRLGLAKALMHRPKLLILDEPINGLDPEGIVEVRELLKSLAASGSTIFLSSHILGEISKVANRIGIIHNGRLVKELTTAELSGQLISKLQVDTSDNKKAAELLEAAGYKSTVNDRLELELRDEQAIQHPEKIAELLMGNILPPKKLLVTTEDLEMYFLRTIRQ